MVARAEEVATSSDASEEAACGDSGSKALSTNTASAPASQLRDVAALARAAATDMTTTGGDALAGPNVR